MNDLLKNMIRASLEDANVVENINPLTDQNVSPIDEVLLEAAEATVVATNEVEESDRAVETLVDSEEQVGELAENLEEQISTESMTPALVRTHNIAMANALRPLARANYDVSRVTVSHEAFGSSRDVKTASLEALEGAKKALKDIAAAIISAVRSAYQAAKNFFVNMGKSGQALANGATKVKSAAVQVGAKPSGKKVNASGAAKFLADGSNFSIGAAIDGLKRINKNLVTVGANTQKAGSVLLDWGIKASEGEFDQGKFGVELSNASFNGLDSSLPGGYAIKQVVGAVPTIEFQKGESFSGEAEIDLPDQGQITELCDAVRALGMTMVEFDRKHFKKLESDTEKLLKDLQKASVAAEKDSEKAASLKSNLSKVSKMSHFAKSVSQKYISYAGSAGKSALGLASACVKAYGKSA